MSTRAIPSFHLPLTTAYLPNTDMAIAPSVTRSLLGENPHLTTVAPESHVCFPQLSFANVAFPPSSPVRALSDLHLCEIFHNPATYAVFVDVLMVDNLMMLKAAHDIGP